MQIFNVSVPVDQAWRVAETFRVMIYRMLSCLDKSTLSLCDLTSKDIKSISRWNGKTLQTSSALVHHLIKQRAALSPKADAVCAWDGGLSYGELDQLSDSLSQALLSLGVGPEMAVILCFDKSKWAVIAMIAVLKAGGVCVPVSPSFSTQRMKEIASATNAEIAISGYKHAQHFAHLGFPTTWSSAISIISNTNQTSTIQKESIRAVDCANTAFIVFTSGSTGQPKGVMKDHISVSTSAITHGKTFFVNESSRVLQFASHIWSISIYDFISTLIYGACLCIPSESDRLNGLSKVIRDFKITHATLAPSVITVLKPDNLPSLQVVTLGGEPVLKANIAIWSEKVRLFNNYGTSETLCAAATELTKSRGGRVVGNHTGANYCWIVDPGDHNKLMPVGGIGELVVQGQTVACGYLNNPERTKASFIQPPIWAETNFKQQLLHSRRFYKTGDLVRYGVGGEIETMGRVDDQIQIRGQRVELGEIEHFLKSYMPMAKHVVAGLSSSNGRKQEVLSAFICLHRSDNSQPGSQRIEHREIIRKTLGRIEDKLRRTIPNYMIPAYFYLVLELPQTASGKLDRRGLRKMAERGELGQPLMFSDMRRTNEEEPLSDSEQVLLHFWDQVLSAQTRSASPNDNFFHRGGDSVDAITLAHIMRLDGYILTVEDIFSSPQLRKMAATVQFKPTNLEDVPPYTTFSLLPGREAETIIAEAADQCQLSRQYIEDVLPCTTLQEGLMVLSQLQKGSYVAQHEFRMTQPWTREHLQNTWTLLVNEVPILRTRIVQSRHRACFQVVVRGGDLPPVNNSPALAPGGSQIPVMSFGSPLVYVKFVKNEEDDCYQWIWACHHAIYDGWSVDLILSRFEELLANPNPSRTQPATPSFRSFVEYLQKADRASSEKYWRSQLSAFSGSQFPAMPHSWQLQANKVRRCVVPIIVKSLTFTMSTLIRAAWSVVMSRYTCNTQVIFGATTMGRSVPLHGIKDIIGPTIATVPVRVSVEDTTQVSDFLATLQKQSTDMLPHEQFGLQNIQRLNGDAERACRFQSLLIVQPQSRGVKDRMIVQTELFSKNYLSYALTIECTLSPNAIFIEATFDERLIDTAQLDRMLSQFSCVLNQLQCNADSRFSIGELHLMSPSDETEILGWNSTPPRITNSSLTTLIEERVAQCPLAPAICAWDGNLSYTELDKWSTQLAHHLSLLGVYPECFVAICFRKSRWIVVAILAVMKAGGAFVLLDLTHPVDRLKHIVQSVAAKVAICFPEDTKVGLELDLQLVQCTEVEIRSLPLATCKVTSQPTPENAIYATFTSGSTGMPKGIIVEHWQCASGFQAQVDAGLFTSDSRMLQFASASFDSAIEQILCPLLAGGVVCIPHEDDRLQRLSEIISIFNVNIADLTPSVAKLLLPQAVPTLETLRLSGEPVGDDLLARWDGHVILENSYGPSECTVTSMTNRNLRKGANASNIGHPVGCRAWIVELNDFQTLAAIGTIGELVISGPIVARGYIDSGASMDSGFISPPSWVRKFEESTSQNGHTVERFYRTGDMVRYDYDGTICFIGRTDSQVKINGQRLELQEIEQQLLSHDTVSDAIVMKPSAGIYGGRLLALIQLHAFKLVTEVADSTIKLVGADNAPLVQASIEDIRQFLADRIPSFMVPTELIAFQRFPLSRSGKTDRKSLEDWALQVSARDVDAICKVSDISSSHASLLPTETTAHRLSEIVADACSREDTGQKDFICGNNMSLMAAGADSISIIHILKTIKHEFGIELPLRALYGGATFRTLAEVINKFDIRFGVEPVISIDFAKDALSLLKRHFMDVETNEIVMAHEEPKIFLLTGATGYIGTQLLRHFLEQIPEVKVVTLVRASDESHALRRLKKSAQLAQWWTESYLQRLEIWVGNLESFQLGLKPSQWQRLIGSKSSPDHIHAIIHNGAVVNWFSDYEALRNANTMSMAYLLEALRSSRSLQRLIYVSGGPQWDPNKEEPDDDASFNVMLQKSNGYGQSKLVAERMLSKTMSPKVSIVKPGFVIGTLTEGIANTDDFIWRIVAGSTAIGGYNSDEAEMWLFLVGTDSFSAIISDCLQSSTHEGSRKILEGLPVGEFWRAVNVELGVDLLPMPHALWLQKLEESVEAGGHQHPCWPIMHMARNRVTLGGEKPQQLENLTEKRQRAVNTVKKNVRHLLKIGYLPYDGGEVVYTNNDAFGRGRNWNSG